MPGSSDVYVGGVVSYAITVKTAVLSVPEALIEDHGVVSEECAVAMAEGVRSLTGADLAVATTGVAGPGPRTGWPPAPSGWPWSSGSGHQASGLTLPGDRDGVRRDACAAALELAMNFQPSA